jgi:hypothetical protein
MTEAETRMADAVESYRSLTTVLVTKWGDLASSIADEMDSGEYDGKAMFDAWAKTTRLTAETGVQMWAEALAAARILSGEQYEPDKRHSDPCQSPLEGATLELEGPLVGLKTRKQLHAEVRPPTLEDGKTEFVVHADATGFPGDTYIGKVLASRGDQVARVDVWITVP